MPFSSELTLSHERMYEIPNISRFQLSKPLTSLTKKSQISLSSFATHFLAVAAQDHSAVWAWGPQVETLDFSYGQFPQNWREAHAENETRIKILPIMSSSPHYVIIEMFLIGAN